MNKYLFLTCISPGLLASHACLSQIEIDLPDGPARIVDSSGSESYNFSNASRSSNSNISWTNIYTESERWTLAGSSNSFASITDLSATNFSSNASSFIDARQIFSFDNPFEYKLSYSFSGSVNQDEVYPERLHRTGASTYLYIYDLEDNNVNAGLPEINILSHQSPDSFTSSEEIEGWFPAGTYIVTGFYGSFASIPADKLSFLPENSTASINGRMDVIFNPLNTSNDKKQSYSDYWKDITDIDLQIQKFKGLLRDWATRDENDPPPPPSRNGMSGIRGSLEDAVFYDNLSNFFRSGLSGNTFFDIQKLFFETNSPAYGFIESPNLEGDLFSLIFDLTLISSANTAGTLSIVNGDKESFVIDLSQLEGGQVETILVHFEHELSSEITFLLEENPDFLLDTQISIEDLAFFSSSVPEPSSLAIFLLGGLGVMRRRVV